MINLNNNIHNIIQALYSINDIYHQKYKNSMLILSNKTVSHYKHPYIFSYIYNNKNMEIILKKINQIRKIKLIQQNNYALLDKINKELEYIGYNASYNGTKYIAESIAILYNNYDNGEILSKDVYPIIAKKYNKSINNIKCNIAKATTSMYYDCDINRLKQYFKFYSDYKPKPKNVIYTILNKL